MSERVRIELVATTHRGELAYIAHLDPGARVMGLEVNMDATRGGHVAQVFAVCEVDPHDIADVPLTNTP